MGWAELGAWVIAQGVPDGECLLWPRSLSSSGYGQLRWRKRMRYAHRLAYAAANGLDEAALAQVADVMRECDRPTCIQPAHLRGGTRSQNMADASWRRRLTQARLTPEDVLAIRRRYAAGESQRSLGREYGVTHGAIGRAVRGQNWRWLKEEAHARL